MAANPGTGRTRLPTHGGLLPWEFEKKRQEVSVRVEGQLTFNTSALYLRAVIDGLGLGYCPGGAAFSLLVEALRYRDERLF